MSLIWTKGRHRFAPNTGMGTQRHGLFTRSFFFVSMIPDGPDRRFYVCKRNADGHQAIYAFSRLRAAKEACEELARTESTHV